MEIIVPVNELVEILSVELNTIETTGELVFVDTDTIEYIEVGMQGIPGAPSLLMDGGNVNSIYTSVPGFDFGTVSS
jgi:hypothetical protein